MGFNSGFKVLILTQKASMNSQQPAPNNVTCCSLPSITRPKRNHVKEIAATLRQWLLLTLPQTQASYTTWRHVCHVQIDIHLLQTANITKPNWWTVIVKMNLLMICSVFPALIRYIKYFNTLQAGDADLRFWHGESRYICKFSLVPLRKGECFQRYHTLKHY